MTEQVTEPTTSEDGVVLEDSEQDQARMRELDERIEAQGGIEAPDEDVGTRGGFGSPASMIAEARKHIGYRETGDNDTIFNRWLGAISSYPNPYGYPWCQAFQSYCLAHSDNADGGPRTASCSDGVRWFEQRGRMGQNPHVGDLVYYGKGGGTHVELVTAVTPTSIQTIGGNTGGSLSGAYFNGDGVYEKTVQRTSKIYGYGSPVYSIDAVPATDIVKVAAGGGLVPGTTVKPITTVRSIKQQQIAVNKLGYTPPLDTDGEWGPKSEAGVKWLQKKIGTTADGQWGQGTEKAFKAFNA
jgi:hypothetical protein